MNKKILYALAILFFIDTYPVFVINTTQFVFFINYGSDVEVLGPDDRLDMTRDINIVGKFLSKKDPVTQKYIEVPAAQPFTFKTSTREAIYIMAAPNSTNLVIGNFIQ